MFIISKDKNFYSKFDENGELEMEEFRKLFSKKTKFVSIAHVSSALGTVNPVKEIIAEAHRHGVLTLVDGAQSTPHISIDVQDLDCDFFAFSGHKIYGPTGIGILYGKESLLNSLPPYMGGGEMIEKVSFSELFGKVASIKVNFEPSLIILVGFKIFRIGAKTS